MKSTGKVGTLPYILTRRKSNRNIVVRVSLQGEVEVSAPYGVSVRQIEAVIRSNRELLEERIVQEQAKLHSFQSGDRFLVRGKWLALTLFVGEAALVIEQDEELVVLLPEEDPPAELVAHVIREHFRKETRKRVAELLPYWASRLAVAIPPITIRDSKRRWASCSSAGRLNFSLRCHSLSDEQLSYLVLHELAHFVHFDHSPAFHRLLAEHMPTYQEIQKSIFSLHQASQLL
ncbi:MAG TPA: SprT family zinc-dependent metalloprotease [Sphaerochaeta sp.]|nr:SprT family zinc-dependent metalloprotease [Sphaerochaeta sp.]